MNVLILGATGMLGYSLFSNLSEYPNLNVKGTVRTLNGVEKFFDMYNDRIIKNVDIDDLSSIRKAIDEFKPNIVINCIGVIKQKDTSKNHLKSVQINALLPHQLASLCDQSNAKLIHFSTDCVFDGSTGFYSEGDIPNANDLYGRSKCLGEVDYGKHLTIRTSIIGHELSSSRSLIDWFMTQTGEVKGFSKAVFSGLPTVYLAKVLGEIIIPKEDLSGLYHISVEPINKYALLSLVSDIYNKKITIQDNSDLNINRSLNSTRFRNKTNFSPLPWEKLIELMHKDYLKRYVH